MPERRAAVDLYWLPLGAGGSFVWGCGRLYERLAAWLGRRAARDLYHCGLQVEVPDTRFVVEQTPVPDLSGEERGVVAEGPVGVRLAGRFRVFRYEVRLWRGGHIPDVAEAVDSPRRLSTDEAVARRVLEVVPKVPTPVWGRDERRTGEMWNSNSVIAWTLARSESTQSRSGHPPAGERPAGRQARRSRGASWRRRERHPRHGQIVLIPDLPDLPNLHLTCRARRSPTPSDPKPDDHGSMSPL